MHDMDIDNDKAHGIEGGGRHSTADEQARQENKSDEPRRHVAFRICAVAGLLCAIAAWLLFYYEPEAAVATGGVGICASVAGLWSGRGCLRSLSVTGLVAAGVLVLVYAAFYWGLEWGVSHL